MIIYLDNCCFNRPFDDQSQVRIRLEAEAKLHIQDQILQKKIEFVWSYILEFENKLNPFQDRREAIQSWKLLAAKSIKESQEITQKANHIKGFGIKSKDALHIACAITAQCDYFLTTDDAILKKMQSYSEIKVVNPLMFISVLEN
jgi:predicted nucleic acid-binding protein